MNSIERPNGNGGNEGAPRQATLREFAAILFRRKWIVLGLFLVTTFTVLVISLATPMVYVSAGDVYVKRGERESSLNPGRRVLDDWEQALGTEMEIVKSERVLRRAREILAAEASGETLSVNPGAIDVEVKGKSNVMAIGYVDADPSIARTVCDAVLRAYVEFRERDFTPSYPRQFFETELTQIEADLERWRSLRREFASHAGVVNVEEQNRQWIVQMSLLDGRRSETRADLAVAETVLEQLRSLEADPETDLSALSALFANELSLVDLKRRILDQEATLASLRERLREEAVDVVNARKTLDVLKALLARELRGRLQVASARVEQLASRLAVIDRDMQAIRSQLQTMPEMGTRLAAMDREIELLERRQQELREKSDQALVTENTSSSINVLLLEPAGAPRPVNARDYVRLALAPAFSIVVGIGLAFFVDSLDLTVRTARHAEEVAELPVLATLTDRRRRSRPAGSPSENPTS